MSPRKRHRLSKLLPTSRRLPGKHRPGMRQGIATAILWETFAQSSWYRCLSWCTRAKIRTPQACCRQRKMGLSAGIAQWARTDGVNIAGTIQDRGIADLGCGVQVQTTSINANPLLVKYNSRGEPLRAKALRDEVRRGGSNPLAIDRTPVYVSAAVLSLDEKPKDEAFLMAYDFAGNPREVQVAHGISP